MERSSGYLTLAEAVEKALSERKDDLFAQPRIFLGLLMDYMDPDSVELCVLERNCDGGLLRPYRDAVAGSSDCELAAAYAEEYLTRRCRIGASDARLVAYGIAEGVSRWVGDETTFADGFQVNGADTTPTHKPIPDVVRRESHVPISDGATDEVARRQSETETLRYDDSLREQNRKISQQAHQKKVGTKLILPTLVCVALALILVVYFGIVSSSSTNPDSVQVPLSEDVAKADADSPEEGADTGKSDSKADDTATAADTTETDAKSVSVSDPRVEADSSMNAGQRITWDCVWLGSYPQSEITSSDKVYESLESASWDDNGDAAVGGMRYRRMSRVDAINYFAWPDDAPSFRYFRWEPVKWRVLETDGSTALAVADVALSYRHYNESGQDMDGWGACSLRTWLNEAFWDEAFSAVQQKAVVSQSLSNDDSIYYGTPGGDATTDKVFLLAESDVCSSNAAARHGFVHDYDTCDEARYCKASSYACGMGAYIHEGGLYEGNCPWWLRSLGGSVRYAACVNNDGSFDRYGESISSGNPVRPALTISLSSDQVSYAGTVSSNGTVDF